MKSVLLAGGDLTNTHREAMAAIQKHLLHTDFDIDALGPITPEELAAAIPDRALREQIANALVTSTLLNEHVSPRHADAVERYASALGVSPHAVGQLRSLAEERFLRLRLDILRHGPSADGMRKLYESAGALGFAKNLLGFAGLLDNPEIAEKYKGLSAYPDGTLGKELFNFYTSRGFKFPGEKGGAPEGLLNHDLTHILGGYETDLASEGRVLAFTAGYRREHIFGTLVFIIMQAQHGVKLTPLAEAKHGFLSSTPHLITDMIEAFARGSQMNVDLMGDWDYWAVMDRPVAELRQRYGIRAQA